jgi:hypothetical protein
MEVDPGTVRAPQLRAEWVNSRPLLYDVIKQVNLFMASFEGGQAVEVLQGGKPLAPEDAGEDVRFDENARSFVSAADPRMYRLVCNGSFGQRLLRLVSGRTGLPAYAFTFVTCAAGDEGAEAASG